MTYTMHIIKGYYVFVSDTTGKVHHAVAINTSNPVTLYPYEPCKTGGLDYAPFYTLKQARGKLARER